MVVSRVSNRPAASVAAQQVRAQAAMASRVPIARDEVRLPEKSAINLPGKIINLLDTQIATKGDVAVFETGAEFWDMLRVAVAPDR